MLTIKEGKYKNAECKGRKNTKEITLREWQEEDEAVQWRYGALLLDSCNSDTKRIDFNFIVEILWEGISWNEFRRNWLWWLGGGNLYYAFWPIYILLVILLDLLLNPEDAGNIFFRNVRISPNYKASQTWYLVPGTLFFILWRFKWL
jgi:hypothetical protein